MTHYLSLRAFWSHSLHSRFGHFLITSKFQNNLPSKKKSLHLCKHKTPPNSALNFLKMSQMLIILLPHDDKTFLLLAYIARPTFFLTYAGRQQVIQPAVSLLSGNKRRATFLSAGSPRLSLSLSEQFLPLRGATVVWNTPVRNWTHSIRVLHENVSGK